MESEDSTNEEEVFMKLSPNKAEIPTCDLDVTINGNEEFENISDLSEHMQV